jgi:integrase/recombinase XerD
MYPSKGIEPMPEFSEFVRERKFLKNVTPRTLSWYEQSWKSWLKHGGDPKSYVVNLREAGVSAISVNSYARALNAYFRWAGLEHRIPKLREEQKVLPVLSANDIARIISFRPTKRTVAVHVMCLLLLDTGVRINEALSIRIKDVDFDNLLITVKGKGNKSRVIPMSFELRKAIWKFNHDTTNGETFLFQTRTGRKLSHRNTYRSIKVFLERIGVTPPVRMIHSFRHTFAITFLRNGGSVFHLQRILGHSTLEMTRRYVNLTTDDLQESHQRCSPLNHLRGEG